MWSKMSCAILGMIPMSWGSCSFPCGHRTKLLTWKALLRYQRGASLVQTHLPPAGPYERVCCSGGHLLDISAQKRWQNNSKRKHSSPDGAPISFVSSCHLPSMLSCRYLHCHSLTKERWINTNKGTNYSPVLPVKSDIWKHVRNKKY